MEDNQPHVIAPYSCGSCDHRWSGVSRCHCGVNVNARVSFAAVTDPKKAKIMAAKYETLHPIGVAMHLMADLVTDPLAEPIRRARFAVADPSLTQHADLSVGGFTEITWGATDGRQITAAALRLDAPADNPLAKVVALDLHGRVFSLRSTLPRTRGEQAPADSADIIDVHVRAGCHRTFTGEGAFAQHHVGGNGCQDPATLVRKEGSKVGTRLLFLNNGLWGSEEHPADPGAALRELRERKAAELVNA